MIFTKDLPIDSDFPDSCVYWIYHEDPHSDPRVSGYVGVSVKGANQRFKQHISEANRGSTLLVHKALRKHGDQIKVKTLVTANPEFCLLMEALLRPTPNMQGCWNLNAGGETTRLGSTCSDATKALLRDANLGKKCSQKTKDLLSSQRKGRKTSESTKVKMSIAQKGKVCSDEEILRLTEIREKRIETTCSWDMGVAKSNHAVWWMAADIYSAREENPEFGRKRIAAMFGLKEWNMRYLLKKLEGGWIPTNDQLWIAFKHKELNVT